MTFMNILAHSPTLTFFIKPPQAAGNYTQEIKDTLSLDFSAIASQATLFGS